MNKRIQELAEQAGLLPREIGPVVETRHMKKKEQDLEKFAELIVRECIDIVPWQYELKIKQHFGVEESRREKFRKSFEEAFKDGVDLFGKETP